MPALPRLLPAVLIAAVVCVSATTAPASGKPRPCPAAGERVVVRSDDAVVVRHRAKHRRTTFAGCSPTTGRRVELGTAQAGRRRDAVVGPFAIGGTVVAWGTSTAVESRPETADLHVVDLRRPRRLREAIVPHDLPIREVAVDALGRVAALTEVEAVVLDGDMLRRVDAGARGTLTGLALDGDDATWSHAGQPQRAPLTLPFGDCTPEEGAFQPIAGPQAVLAQRTSGLADTSRIEIVACLRGSGGGFFAIGEERGELAGTVAAALRRDASGGYSVNAVDLTTRAAIGAPVPLGHEYDPWALARDGTIVVERAGRLIAQLPDGRETEVAGNAAGTRFILVDDLLRTVVWDRGSAALPAG
ncbi:MAG TPA: hypothetical protein VFR97_06455 [Capillimicrobium sp.]|nr:hypothetical protein [Capillimicrobium sp.]